MNALKSRVTLPLALLSSLVIPAAAEPIHPTTDKPIILAQQCRQRVGPFATEDMAWRRYTHAQRNGYAVSQRVFPCWDGERGYCYMVFSC